MTSPGRSWFDLPLFAICVWAVGWTVHAAPWQTSASRESSRHDAFGGVWSLDREASQLADRRNAPPQRGDGLPGGRSGGDRRGGGGFGGFGGFGGRGGRGFPGGSSGRGDGADAEQMQAMTNYMRSLMEPSERLTIVVHPTSVGFTDADGRTVTLQTNSKSVDERAENGLVKLKRKAKWDGAVLVLEIDIDNGPQMERRYELFRDGEQLHISTTTSGGGGGPGGSRGVPPVLHVYDRERPQQVMAATNERFTSMDGVTRPLRRRHQRPPTWQSVRSGSEFEPVLPL